MGKQISVIQNVGILTILFDTLDTTDAVLRIRSSSKRICRYVREIRIIGDRHGVRC